MFEFLRLPFGLRNARITFQRMMDQILGGLPFCFVYVDNILIFSPDEVLCRISATFWNYSASNFY